MKKTTRKDRALDRRLLLASGAVAVAAVPVAIIGYAASHGWGPLHRLDSGAATNLHAWALSQPGAVRFLEGVSTVFDPWVLRTVAAGAVVALAVRGERRLARWAATTVVVAGALGFGLKLVVARSRPALPDPVSNAPGSSFPSGHALNSFVIIGTFVLLALPAIPARWRPVAWVVGGSIVLLVGFARVALGVHYVSDVVAGWLVGAGVLGATVLAFDTWRRPQRRPVKRILKEGVDPEGTRAASTSPQQRSETS